MADQKNTPPKKDGKVQDLPQKKISKDDAEQVKGGMMKDPISPIKRTDR